MVRGKLNEKKKRGEIYGWFNDDEKKLAGWIMYVVILLCFMIFFKLISQLGSHESLTPKRCMSVFCFYILLYYGMLKTGKERTLCT